MVARPAVSPRSKSGADSDSPGSQLSESQPLPSTDFLANDQASLDLSDFVFSQSSPDFQVGEEIDPIEAEAQEAAVLFANGQDEAVRILLEHAVHNHPFGPGERLWLMLFDLYWLSANRPAFETLGVEYAQSFEKSPPAWRDRSARQVKSSEAAVPSLLFRGDLTGDNRAAFDPIVQSLAKSSGLRLDLSRVGRLDAEGCARLLALLQQAKKRQCVLHLVGREALSALLKERMVAGTAENKECWLLFLELCQLDGLYDLFEDVAVQFAVTFELSPPSWESARVASPKPAPDGAPGAKEAAAAAGSFVLCGEVKVLRFADLVAYAELRDTVLIDCSELTRIDFISAGALLNALMTIARSGKSVVFRHPNHLVAELFGVVGLTAFARILFAK